MTTTQLPTHPTWCHEHTDAPDSSSLGYCDSVRVPAGRLAVQLGQVDGCTPEVEIFTPSGRSIGVQVEDLWALREALGLVTDVLNGHCAMPGTRA